MILYYIYTNSPKCRLDRLYFVSGDPARRRLAIDIMKVDLATMLVDHFTTYLGPVNSSNLYLFM